MTAPLVSAVLPFANPRRLNLVRKAVNQFIRQHYTPYELIVVNGTESRVLTNDAMDTDAMRSAGCRILEVHVSPNQNAAAMRNHGLRAASGEWAICIDDDDYFHPDRLLYQMAHRRDGQICLLRCQLRVNVAPALMPPRESELTPTRPLLALVSDPAGIPCTMLFPRVQADGTVWQFKESCNTGEFEELLGLMTSYGVDRVVCDNVHNPFVQERHWPLLSVAIYHGGNELTLEDFFPDQPSAAGVVPPGLNWADLEQLKVVLQSYNFAVQ